MYLVTAQEMRLSDQYTIEQMGVPGIILMDHAGKAVTDAVIKQFPDPKQAVVMVGPGNNGGDGWVAARYLSYQGWTVHLWLVGKEDKLTKDAKQMKGIWERIAPYHVYQEETKQKLIKHLQEADVILDALLGTGVKGALRPDLLEVVQLINQQVHAWKVAVDLPTGVDADTGEIRNVAIQADLTVTFEYPKWGHYLFPGADACGKLEVAKIGLAPDREFRAKMNTPKEWESFLQPRKKWAHKGTYGHLWVLGGAEGMLGAIKMAGEAAYRTGAGMVTCTVPSSQRIALSATLMQEVIWSWPGESTFHPESAKLYAERAQRFSAVAVGPGLGRFDGEESWLGELLQHVHVPLILDADALNILADYPAFHSVRSRNLVTVCTPHPGECARLLKTTISAIESNRPQAAMELASKLGATVVLKGRYTIIAFPDGNQLLNVTGSSALAKAGSGDVLTGMIGSLLAQKIPADKAVPMGVYLHGKAAEGSGEAHSMTANDLLYSIGPAIQQVMTRSAQPS